MYDYDATSADDLIGVARLPLSALSDGVYEFKDMPLLHCGLHQGSISGKCELLWPDEPSKLGAHAEKLKTAMLGSAKDQVQSAAEMTPNLTQHLYKLLGAQTRGDFLMLNTCHPEPITIDVGSLEVSLGTYTLSKRTRKRGENFRHTLQLVGGSTKQEFLLGFEERNAMVHFACLLDEFLGEYRARQDSASLKSA